MWVDLTITANDRFQLNQTHYNRYQRMLRKGHNFTNPAHPTHPASHSRPFKSAYEHTQDHTNTSEVSPNGSIMVSPTFQSAHVVSLKDDLFRQDPPKYLSIGFTLKDINNPDKPIDRPTSSLMSNSLDRQGQLEKEVEILKGKLTEHYQSKRYWKKIEKLFQQEDVDAVLAWQDSIDKYQALKNEVGQHQAEVTDLQGQLQQAHLDNARLQQQLEALQRQVEQDRNETRVLSQKKEKKCKECEQLKQKEKEHFELNEKYKKLARQQEEGREKASDLSEKLRQLDEKYNDLTFLNQELQKKNAQLADKEKELTLALHTHSHNLAQQQLTQQNQLHQLHIQIEQLKEAKYQTDKTLAKVEEKYRRESGEQYAQVGQQLAEAEKKRSQVEMQLEERQRQLEEGKRELAGVYLQHGECQEIQRRQVQDIKQQANTISQLQAALVDSQQEVTTANQLLHQADSQRQQLQAELAQLAQLTQNEDAQHANNSHFCLAKTKNPHAHPNQPSSNISRRITAKIKDIYLSLKPNEDSLDSYPRRKEEDSECSLPQAEKYIHEIGSDVASLVNRYEYLRKDNDILKEQLQNELKYKQQEMETLHRQVNLKQQALKCIAGFVPDELKDSVLQFLFLTERLSSDDPHEQQEMEEYDELRYSLENESRQWKEDQARRQKRTRQLEEEVRQLEEELRRAEEECREAARRLRGREGKENKKVATDYDYREAVSKKEIRRKYEL